MCAPCAAHAVAACRLAFATGARVDRRCVVVKFRDLPVSMASTPTMTPMGLNMGDAVMTSMGNGVVRGFDGDKVVVQYPL